MARYGTLILRKWVRNRIKSRRWDSYSFLVLKTDPDLPYSRADTFQGSQPMDVPQIALGRIAADLNSPDGLVRFHTIGEVWHHASRPYKRLDVLKMQVTAEVRLCEPGWGQPRPSVRESSMLPVGFRWLTNCLQGHGMITAALEGTGISSIQPFESLDAAAVEAELFHAQHVR